MTKSTTLLILTILVSNISCGQITNDKTAKQKGIKEFKKEMKSLCDSSEIYFEYAFRELDKGADPDEVSMKIKGKIQRIESRIDSTSRTFQYKAAEFDLTEKEYEQVYQDLKSLTQPMMSKYQELTERGVELE